jgi:hypothetical protein
MLHGSLQQTEYNSPVSDHAVGTEKRGVLGGWIGGILRALLGVLR